MPDDPPSSKRLTIRDRTLILGGAGCVLWFVMAVTVIADVALHDRIPDPVPTAFGLVAATATLAAVALSLWAEVRQTLEQLAAGQAQLMEAMATMEEAFDMARRFEGALSERGQIRMTRQNATSNAVR